MLHVTNGDTMAAVLRAADVQGDVLPWRDVLHDGPVPAGLDDEALAATRAVFIAERGWGVRDSVLRTFLDRDRTLARALERGSPLVLWFEDDYYDVLLVLQVLERVLRAGAENVRLCWLPRKQPDPMDVHPALATAAGVTHAQLECAGRAWSAFRAPDPGALTPGACDAIPHLREAIERHFEQFPALGDGLDRAERQLLDAVAAGARAPADAFLAAQAHEERPWLGDWTAFWYLARMAAEPAPLLALGPRGLILTALGGAVLRGEEDWPPRQGSAWDRWRGGVRLRGPAPAWRYDPVERELVRVNGRASAASPPPLPPSRGAR